VFYKAVFITRSQIVDFYSSLYSFRITDCTFHASCIYVQMVDTENAYSMSRKVEVQMEFEDYLEPEVAVTALVAATLFSKRGRQLLRRGAVYGLAGILAVGDNLTSFSRNLGQNLQAAGTSAAQMTRDLAQQARAGAEAAGASVTNVTERVSPETSSEGTTEITG
jgi:hypothetical protein